MTRKKAQPVVQPTEDQVSPTVTPVTQQDKPQETVVAPSDVLKTGTFTTLSGATLIRN